MVMQRRFEVGMDAVFPAGAWLAGPVEPVTDFNAQVAQGQPRPQKVDEDTGLLVWQVPVMDADPEAGKRDKLVSVKLLAPHQPVPPENKSGTPFTPIRFEGLTATPWIDDSMQRVEGGQVRGRARIAWSFRATGFSEVKQPSRSQQQAA